MTKFEENEKYKALVSKLSEAMVSAAHDGSGEPFDAMMIACDVSAEVILTAFPRDEWLPVLDIFLTRLGNTMDRRAAASEQ